MKTILEVLKNLASSLASGTGKTLSVYGKILKGYAKFSLVASLCLLPLPVLGVIFKTPWLIGVYIAVLGILSVAGLVLLSPILALAKAASDRISSFKKTLVRLISFLFWLLAVAIYFFVVPVSNPATLILIILIFGLMALGYAAFGIRTSPRLAFGLAVLVLIVLSFGSLLPDSQANLANGVRALDKAVTSLITPAPKRVDLKSFAPFDLKDGKARVWYYKDPQGKFEFYDRPGYHWSGVPLKEITIQAINEYMEFLTPKPDITPRKVDLSSYPPFDPVNGKPRVWYYQSPDGRYEFYDNPGFHWSGDQLRLITPQVVDGWRQMEEKRKKVEEAQRVEAERQLQLKANEERLGAERRAEIERQAEAERLAAERARERVAENVAPTPTPITEPISIPKPVSPPKQAANQPTWEQVYQVWIDQDMSLGEVSRLVKKVNESGIPAKQTFRFGSRRNIVSKPMRLVAFGRSMTTEQVCSYFDEQAVKPATFKEILFLSAEYPETAKQFPIVALGPACEERDYSHDRTYKTTDFKGSLETNRIISNWDKDTRFASVLK